MFGCHYCYHLFKYMPWWAGLIWVDWNGSCHFATICSCLLYRNFELIGVLSKLQKKFEFWTSKAGWRVYSGFRTKVVRGNRVSSSFQKSSGHNFSGKYFLGTRIQLHKLQTKRPRWTALSEKNRRSVIPISSSLFRVSLDFFSERVRLSLLLPSIQVYALMTGLLDWFKWQLTLLLLSLSFVHAFWVDWNTIFCCIENKQICSLSHCHLSYD